MQDTVALSTEEVTEHLQHHSASISLMESKLVMLESYHKEFDKRFSIIFPILKEFRQAKSTSLLTANLLHQMQALSEKVVMLEQMSWQHITVVPSPVSIAQTPSLGEADLKDLKHQLKILQHRIVGGGVKIGATNHLMMFKFGSSPNYRNEGMAFSWTLSPS
jgi:hypothetical protein